MTTSSPATHSTLSFLTDALQAPAPAHCEPARRAQMCLRHGQAGSRGSADPLEAYGVEYLIGIFDGQVGSSLRLHTLCKLALPRTHATPIATTRPVRP